MLITLQILRALAAWLVVGHHTVQIYFGLNNKNLMSQFFSEWGDIGVDLFFIVSGFVIYLTASRKNCGFMDFMKNRIARIAPAYWMVTLITSVVIIAFPQLQKLNTFSLEHLIASLLFIPVKHPNGIGHYPIVTVGWTLNFEMMFYLIFGLTRELKTSLRMPALAAGIVGIFFMLPSTGLISEFYNNNIAFEFLAGVGLGSLWLNKKFNPNLKKSLTFSALSLVFLIVFKDAERIFKFGIPSFFIVLAFLNAEGKIKHCDLLSRLGELSYSTYLFHCLVLYFGSYLANYYQLSFSLTIGMSMVFIYLISILSHSAFELRVTKWLRKDFNVPVLLRTFLLKS